jgi:hypothetical protein
MGFSFAMSYDPKIPVAHEYVSALGRAAYNFSYFEWGIVWLTETLSPGFLNRVGGMTAGTIAREFQDLAAACQETDADDLKALASTFADLVRDRNGLLHGVPYTAGNGEQRLRHIGPSGKRDWSVEMILAAAQRFEIGAIEAGRLLHAGRHAAYTAATGRSLSV